MNYPVEASGLTTTAAPAYQPGFGNASETETLPGALPFGRNSPQRCAYGLYVEEINDSPFTTPRAANERSRLYRVRPTVRSTTVPCRTARTPRHSKRPARPNSSPAS